MNRLAKETSPYLLQHKNNPVDWYPWKEVAFQKAREENKPIFLSIGYAACHWCHVMAHESFENPATAHILNQHYISIKVDREERPDIDQIYMSAVVALTGQGGWPLSVFLTPDLKPFYGGTYFPPIQRYGMPSFTDIILSILQSWQNDPEKIYTVADQLTQHLLHSQHIDSDVSTEQPIHAIDYARTFYDRFDWQFGGWGNAPKFPAPMAIEFLLQCESRQSTDTVELAYQTLHQMAQGGIYDLVDGGFHRYSTDATWTVPHFEKMLYDNAQMASVYTHAYQLTGNMFFRQIAEGTLNFLLSQMQHSQGVFFSSQDADVNNSEGAYYLWHTEELKQHNIPDEGLSYLELPAHGHIDQQFLLKIRPPKIENAQTYANFESFSFEKIQPVIDALVEIRKRKTKPGFDDKIILSWNTLAIFAFLDAGLAFDKPELINAATRCTDFILQNMVHEKSLDHTWRNEKGSEIGFLEDYAGLIIVLLRIYHLTTKTEYHQLATRLIQEMLEKFSHSSGSLQNTANNQENLITPMLDYTDMVTPSGFSLAAQAIQMYAYLNPTSKNNVLLEPWFQLVQSKVKKHPTAYAHWLQQFLAYQTPQTSFIISYHGDSPAEIDELRRIFYSKYRPHSLFMAIDWQNSKLDHHAEIFLDKPPVRNQLTLYYCKNFTCQQPITDIDQMTALLQ